MSQISLVGLPGVGKSTVGRHLARHLKAPVRRLGHRHRAREIGCSIREFFEREGEQRFRDIEQRVIGELAGRPDTVLATGGGAVLREANRKGAARGVDGVLPSNHPDELFRRLRHDTHRPLLQVRDPLRKLRELFAERDPLYRKAAHYVVETGRPSVATLVNMVLMQLRARRVRRSALVPSPVEPRPPSQG